jgi:hypothetical protein
MIENPNSQIKAAITNNLRVREIRGLMEGALVTMTSENVRSLALVLGKSLILKEK